MTDENYKGREYQRGWISPAKIQWLCPLENRWDEVYSRFVKEVDELIQEAGGKNYLQIRSGAANGSHKDLVIHISPDGTVPIL